MQSFHLASCLGPQDGQKEEKMKLPDNTDMPWHRKKALARYQVISAYLALDPPRGQRRQVLKQLADRSWEGPDGEPFCAAADTIRVWVRRYKKKGLAGLEDKPVDRKQYPHDGQTNRHGYFSRTQRPWFCLEQFGNAPEEHACDDLLAFYVMWAVAAEEFQYEGRHGNADYDIVNQPRDRML